MHSEWKQKPKPVGWAKEGTTFEEKLKEGEKENSMAMRRNGT